MRRAIPFTTPREGQHPVDVGMHGMPFVLVAQGKVRNARLRKWVSQGVGAVSPLRRNEGSSRTQGRPFSFTSVHTHCELKGRTWVYCGERCKALKTRTPSSGTGGISGEFVRYNRLSGPNGVYKLDDEEIARPLTCPSGTCLASISNGQNLQERGDFVETNATV